MPVCSIDGGPRGNVAIDGGVQILRFTERRSRLLQARSQSSRITDQLPGRTTLRSVTQPERAIAGVCIGPFRRLSPLTVLNRGQRGIQHAVFFEAERVNLPEVGGLSDLILLAQSQFRLVRSPAIEVRLVASQVISQFRTRRDHTRRQVANTEQRIASGRTLQVMNVLDTQSPARCRERQSLPDRRHARRLQRLGGPLISDSHRLRQSSQNRRPSLGGICPLGNIPATEQFLDQCRELEQLQLLTEGIALGADGLGQPLVCAGESQIIGGQKRFDLIRSHLPGSGLCDQSRQRFPTSRAGRVQLVQRSRADGVLIEPRQMDEQLSLLSPGCAVFDGQHQLQMTATK